MTINRRTTSTIADGSLNPSPLLIIRTIINHHTDPPNNPFSKRNPQKAAPMAKVDLGTTRNVPDRKRPKGQAGNATNIESAGQNGGLQTHGPHRTSTVPKVPNHILFQSNHQILLPLLFD
jgi:hypothetical protein